eukprot:scaffold180167_cov16-Tisochrysis_lutea.AAC.1
MVCNVTAFPQTLLQSLHVATVLLPTVLQALCLSAFDYVQVHVPLVCNQQMGLSYAGSYAGPLWGAVPAAYHT